VTRQSQERAFIQIVRPELLLGWEVHRSHLKRCCGNVFRIATHTSAVFRLPRPAPSTSKIHENFLCNCITETRRKTTENLQRCARRLQTTLMRNVTRDITEKHARRTTHPRKCCHLSVQPNLTKTHLRPPTNDRTCMGWHTRHASLLRGWRDIHVPRR
jgi:hypothetical protein